MGNACSKSLCPSCFKQEETYGAPDNGHPNRAIRSAFSISNKNELDEMIQEVKKLSKVKNLRVIDDVETTMSATAPFSEKLNYRIQVVATWSHQFEECLVAPAKEMN
ncbi:hypothetical protein GOP47_0026390 [Adiantum capillus-veneris]|nr:hypothetical protein GOP47_0026390 [Adiantum capillus-veneris]